MTTAPVKPCVLCGAECDGRPRVKDRTGRYYCKACHDTELERRESSRTPPVEPEQAEPEATPPEEDDAGIIPLADEVPYAAAGTGGAGSCPACGRIMGKSAVICVGCGYNAREGVRSSTLVSSKGESGRRTVPCPSCGYDLSGLRSQKCPECGERITLQTVRDKNERYAAEMHRREYIKPAAWLGVGVVGVAISLLIQGEPLGVVLYGAGLFLEIVIGYAVFWCCQKWLIGDEAPFLLSILRLAGIYALTDLVGELAGLLPIIIVPSLITFVAYMALLMDAFDLEFSDAWLLAILTGVTKFAVAVCVMLIVAKYL